MSCRFDSSAYPSKFQKIRPEPASELNFWWRVGETKASSPWVPTPKFQKFSAQLAPGLSFWWAGRARPQTTHNSFGSSTRTRCRSYLRQVNVELDRRSKRLGNSKAVLYELRLKGSSAAYRAQGKQVRETRAARLHRMKFSEKYAYSFQILKTMEIWFADTEPKFRK